MAPGQGGKIINVQSMHVLDNIVDDSIDALPVRLVYPRRIVLTYSLFLFFFNLTRGQYIHPSLRNKVTESVQRSVQGGNEEGRKTCGRDPFPLIDFAPLKIFFFFFFT